LPKKSVKGQHIYITGAGSGLGRGMALKFAKRGANLTISDINEVGLNETKQMIKTETGSDTNILALQLDISNRQAIADSAKTCVQKFGDVDILINNAGLVQGKYWLDLNEALSQKQYVVNLISHQWIINEFLPSMKKRNSGHIVSIASMAGTTGCPVLTDYCASKAGAVMMMQALQLELASEKSDIVCSTVMPYFINTGMFDGVKASNIFPLLDQKYVINRIVYGIE
jgi:all-trans-retinol dehydrogenase (NAD+)